MGGKLSEADVAKSKALHQAKFDQAISNPGLVRGKVLEGLTFDCRLGAARSADGRLAVRVVRPVQEAGGYIHIVAKGEASGYFSTDFIEPGDRSERILVLGAYSKDFPAAKRPNLDGPLLMDVADMVQTIHAKCFSNYRPVSAYLLVS